MMQYMREDFGNPSAMYSLGITAEKAVKKARGQVAKALGVSADEVFFTSGGTESDNSAISMAARARRKTGNKIIASDIEHPAVENALARLERDGYEIVRIRPDRKSGAVSADEFESHFDDKTVLVTCMHVNNETGAVQPVSEIARRVAVFNKANRSKNTGIIMHVDAVQSFGKLASVKSLASAGVDMIAVSGHKIHGPKGIGAMVIRKGLSVEPFILGGGQEKNMRSGTENVPAIAGFGLACEIADENMAERTAAMANARSHLLSGIESSIEDIIVNSPEDACPSVLNVSFLGTRGEVILHTLETSEIYVSTGSACSSNKNTDSHVLTAMGLNHKEIEGALRFSFSEFNTIEEMDEVLDKLTSAIGRFRKLGTFR